MQILKTIKQKVHYMYLQIGMNGKQLSYGLYVQYCVSYKVRFYRYDTNFNHYLETTKRKQREILVVYCCIHITCIVIFKLIIIMPLLTIFQLYHGSQFY
jgi:hypothetical protein